MTTPTESYAGELGDANGRLWLGGPKGCDRPVLKIVEDWLKCREGRWCEVRLTGNTLTIEDHDGCDIRAFRTSRN